MSCDDCCECDRDDEECECCERMNKLKYTNTLMLVALTKCVSYWCPNDEYTDGRNCRSCSVCIAKTALSNYDRLVVTK